MGEKTAYSIVPLGLKPQYIATPTEEAIMMKRKKKKSPPCFLVVTPGIK
jgi:hypothetical protein